MKVVLRILTGDADNREISDVLWTDNASVGNIRVGAVRQSLALAVWDAYLSNPSLFDSVVNDVEGAVAYALSNDVGNNFEGVRQDLRMDRLAKDASTIVKSLDPLADRETMINLMNDADPGARLKDVLPARAMKLLPKEWQNRPVLAIRDALTFVEFTERPAAVTAEAESEISETGAEDVVATVGVATSVEPSVEAVDVIGRFIDGLTFTKGDKIRSYSIRARLLHHLELLEDYEPAQFRQALARLESAGFGVKWGEENPRAIVSAKAAEVQARADRQNQRAIQREDILRQAKEVADAKVKAKQEKADARLKAKEEKAERAEKWARGKVAQADAAEGIGAKLTAWWDSRVAGKADRKLDQEINLWLTRVEKIKTGLSNHRESQTMLTEQEVQLGQMEDTLVSSEKAVSTLESLAETKRVYQLATTVEGGVEQAEKTIVARAERELGVKKESPDFLTDLDNRVNELRAQLDPRYRDQQTLDDQKKAIGSDLKEVRARRAEVQSQLDRVNALIAKDTEALEQEGVPEHRSKPRHSSFSVSYVQESRPSPYNYGPKYYGYGVGESKTLDVADFVEAYEGYYSPETPKRDPGIEYGGVPVMEATRVDNRGESANVEVYEYKRAASFGSVDPKTQIPYGLKRNDQGMFLLDREFEFVEDENGEYSNLPEIVIIKDYLLGRLGELLISVGGKTPAEKENLYARINNVMETSRGVKGYFEDYLYRKIGEAALDQVARSKGAVDASDQAMFSSVDGVIYGELMENPIADDSPGLSNLAETIKLSRQSTERVGNSRKATSTRPSLIDSPTPPEASALVTAGQGWAAAGSAALTASLVVGMVLLAAFDMTGFVAALAPLVLAGVGAFGYYLNQWRLEIGKDSVGTKPTAEADHGTNTIIINWERFSELMETKWTRWFNPLGFWNPHAAAAGVLWHEQAHLKLGAGEVGAALAQVMPTFVSLGYYVANQWAGRDKKLEFVSGDDTNAMVKALETSLVADGLIALVEKARKSNLEQGGQIVYGLTESAELVVHKIENWEGAGVQATNASLVVNPTAIQPAKTWMPVHVHVVENLDARFPIPSVMDWLSRAGNHQGLVLDRAGNATLYKLDKGEEGLVVRMMSRRADEMQFGPSVSVPLGQYLLEAVKRGETVPLNGANASLLVGLVSASLQEMDLMPARLTLDQINRMEEALRRSVAGPLTSENVPMATSAIVRAYFNAHGEGARPYVGALADMTRVNAIAAEVLRGWGLMPFIASTRESVIIPTINRSAVVSDVMGRMEPGLEKLLGDAIRNGKKSEILRIMADVSNRVMVPAYAGYLGYSIGSKVQVGERPSGGEGMAEIVMKKTSTGIEFEILLDLNNARAADLLAEVNHEVAEAFVYAGMGEISGLEGNDRGDLESLALALSRRVAETAGLRSLGDMGHALFLEDARDHDLRRVDAQRVAEGFIDAVDRTLSGSARTEMFQTAFALAGQGHTLLELTGQVVFPTVIAVDAKSLLNDQGAVDHGTVDSIVQKFSGDSNESTYLLVVDNLSSSAQAERAQLSSLLLGHSRVVLGKEGQGLRNGKINRRTLRSTIPSAFKWDSSLVPMVRLGAMSTNQQIWEGLLPTALKGNVAANLLEALRASRLVNLSA